jgi:hypothetical protein
MLDIMQKIDGYATDCFLGHSNFLKNKEFENAESVQKFTRSVLSCIDLYNFSRLSKLRKKRRSLREILSGNGARRSRFDQRQFILPFLSAAEATK